MDSFHMESPWNPPTKGMESIRKVHGIHQESHGIHVEKVWNPSGKTMESIWKTHGMHPPFDGFHMG